MEKSPTQTDYDHVNLILYSAEEYGLKWEVDHTAQKYLKESKGDCTGVFLATAHPSKFSDILEPVIDKKIELPEILSETMKKKKRSKILKNDYNEFYDYLIETFE